MKTNKITLFTIIVSVVAFAQTHISAQSRTADTVLTLSGAISQAMEHNHEVIIARNDAEIGRNNATWGNSGLLPTVTASGQISYANEDTRQEIAGQNQVQENNGNESRQYQLGATINYTLFDGFGSYYRLKSLETSSELSELGTRLTLESTLLRVIQSYLNVVAQRQLVDVTEQTAQLSKERYESAQKEFELGGRTRVRLLNAEVALNQDSTRLIETRTALDEAKRNLMVLIGEHPSDIPAVETNIAIRSDLAFEDIRRAAEAENVNLIRSRLQTQQSEYALKQQESRWYPRLEASAGYSYSRSESDASFLLYQESNGLNAGLTLSFTIFDGFTRTNDIQNAQISIENNEEQLALARKELSRDLRNAYDRYQTNLYLMQKQELNIETARLNFERTEQAFELGQVSNTDFREAQLSLQQARQEMIRLRINSKISEVELLRLSGGLIEASS